LVASATPLVSSHSSSWCWRPLIIYLCIRQVGADRARPCPHTTTTTGRRTSWEALKAALTYQLQQSPFLKLVSDDEVQRTLAFMKRPKDTRLTEAVTRDVCQRQGVKAMLAGRLDLLGTAYSVSLRAVDCATGDVIAMARQEATRLEDLTKAQDKAVSELRKSLGESLASITKHEVPTQATTTSLEALQLLDQAQSLRARGKEEEAIPLLRRAVAVDPGFGMAWARLSAALSNVGRMSEMNAAASRAFELKDRVSDRERFYIIGRYFYDVTGQFDEATEVFTQWTSMYPRDSTPWGYLSLIRGVLGDYEGAVDAARTSRQLEPNSYFSHNQLLVAQVELGRLDDAKATISNAIEHKLDVAELHAARSAIAMFEGDRATADAEITLTSGKSAEWNARVWQAGFSASHGQLREARVQIERAVRVAESFKVRDWAAGARWSLARVEAAFGNLQEVRARVENLVDGQEEPDAMIAIAALGDATRLEKLAGSQRASRPLGTIANQLVIPLARAVLEIQRGKPETALDHLRLTLPYERSYLTSLAPQYYRGQALLMTGRPADAAVEFQKVLDQPVLAAFGGYLPLAHIGLARARAKAGDAAGSRQAYEDFFTLWKDADPDIPVLQEAKREYAKLGATGK
jgi:tetratricopeptide (TPR) repeat protein